MITEDGRLSYQVELDPGRGFRHRLRHLVNPVVGIGCGMVFGAALFVIAVQALFGMPPGLIALLVAVVAVMAYIVAVVRASTVARESRAYAVVLDESGVAVTGTGGSRHHGWDRFTRWLEDEQDIVLASGGVRQRTVVVVPKVGIPEDELDLLREVLHSHIDPDDDPLEDAFVEMDWDAEPARRTAD